MKWCGKARGGNSAGAINRAPLFPLRYEIAAMDKKGKQVLGIAGRTVAHE